MGDKRINSLQWHELYQKTMDFVAIARQYRFCTDLLDEIEHRIFNLSPFSKNHEK